MVCGVCLGLILVGFIDCLSLFDLIVAYIDFRVGLTWMYVC